MTALGGHRVFVLRQGSEGPTILLLHGLPASSYDWPALVECHPTRDRDVLAFDSSASGCRTSRRPELAAQAGGSPRRARRPLQGGRVYLVAHDMGTSVATELFARELEGRASISISAALLFNGSMLLHLAHPTIGQRLLMSLQPLGPLVLGRAGQRALVPPAAGIGVLAGPPAER